MWKIIHIDSKTVFSSATVVGFGAYGVPLSHPTRYQWITLSMDPIWWLKYQWDYL